MIQQILVNIEKTLQGIIYPEYYNVTVGTNTSTFTLPNMFMSNSTMVFVNTGSGFVYKTLNIDYVENSGNGSITFFNHLSNGNILEVRYNLLVTY